MESQSRNVLHHPATKQVQATRREQLSGVSVLVEPAQGCTQGLSGTQLVRLGT